MHSIISLEKANDVLMGSYLLFFNLGLLKYVNKCPPGSNNKCNTECNTEYKSVCPYESKCGKFNLNLGLSLGVITGLSYIYKGYKR